MPGPIPDTGRRNMTERQREAERDRERERESSPANVGTVWEKTMG